jgi:DNA-binding NtrC family response regulator
MEHTILVVDDEPANLRMIERALRKRFKIIQASSAERALRILEKQTVSLILTDQRMPGLSGTELLRQSRAQHPDAVRMVVTAQSDPATFIEAIRHAGAVRVITKPWDPDKLIEIVSQALEKLEVMMETRQSLSQLREANLALDKIARQP